MVADRFGTGLFGAGTFVNAALTHPPDDGSFSARGLQRYSPLFYLSP